MEREEYAEPVVVVVELGAPDVIAQSVTCDYETPEASIDF